VNAATTGCAAFVDAMYSAQSREDRLEAHQGTGQRSRCRMNVGARTRANNAQPWFFRDT
jgi:hypothetical protein